ncbi:hypothetical protein M2459_002800 [Parabacteroides sp. PF5-5]|uniref:hypothetical protein n=1 Tax=unclassified Parabacteroides TaxID=2649774 RepID=UPI002473E02A|nr:MULTISPECIES: hypothetical protein [unclassified Parabacteroides]MDH6306056.1 hypothetical protein [Parabacteroides sp. PH5-39]MDH6317046.1 hypothetical protein [Parabacteroides sp. PF5-13]MDH6320799.1 hypothetical protein [Parabacteroides sp. PH5-13]MDH6324499.1 hypothetical protein [Parabacteroides sp. PH5-8]MDH6328231.1 hypothetical protein [Parabacteroides sp. PH5-41]
MIRISIRTIYLFFCIIVSWQMLAQGSSGKTWSYKYQSYQLEWELNHDQARMIQSPTGKVFWKGGLLPAFWIENKNGEHLYIKAEVTSLSEINNSQSQLKLRIPNWGNGSLLIDKNEWGICFSELKIQWEIETPRIIEMYWGTTTVPAERLSMLADEQRPFTPDWDAAGYCVPGAKEGTVQSYFRNWDFGHSNIALGSFGPSLGAPYGAAFPRPVLFFAMGDNGGWISFGVGELPDAAMSLKLQSGLGMIKYSYREDLWGASGQKERVWNNPLKITFGTNAYQAFTKYMTSFPVKKGTPSVKHQKATWNTWGNWKERKYDIKPMVDFASKLDVEVFVLDDPWQKTKGSIEHSKERFPHFENDLKYIKEQRMESGFWETLGWIEDPASCGLSKEDLILDKNGYPCLTSWNFNPLSGGFYFIDLSSEKSRDYLKRRTLAEMKFFQPKVIKLDFGYGIPGPQMGVPRNPALRGERHSYELIKLISETAKSVDPDVTILYYGINPIFHEYVDIISLDDQGDIWYAIKEGHDLWSIWASLLSNSKLAITGSSSYEWHKDDEVILNTFILGSANAVLGTEMPDGSPVPDKYLNRRLAVNKWFRRSIQWEPVWLNSHLGDLQEMAELKCWGRQEGTNLTALVLRGEKDSTYDILAPYEWTGRWAIISQDDKSITESSSVAVVPFDSGTISMKVRSKPKKVLSVGIHSQTEKKDWIWKNGELKINISDNELNDIAGFLINY